jgi:hypothetical protein
MRHKGYVRETFVGGVVECLRFDYTHYGEASALYTPGVGMNESDALYLMNRWNRISPCYKYWLAEGTMEPNSPEGI